MKLIKTAKTDKAIRRRDNCGFTLIELIIILSALAILAAIGTVSAINYYKHSKFDQNSEKAIAVYQVAQTALSQKVSDGSINAWIRGLKDNEGKLFTSNLNTLGLDGMNDSASMTISLTYNPGTSTVESQELYDFMSGYFYDRSIFDGTMTVEFYISASYENDGIAYYARVESAFYSIQNSPDPGVCWDGNCTDNGSSEDKLPVRQADYRYNTSYVGYFDGTEESIKYMS